MGPARPAPSRPIGLLGLALSGNDWRDVAPEADARERDPLDRRVGAGSRTRRACRRTPVTLRIRPPFVTSCPSRIAVPAWKTTAPERLRVARPRDRRARVARLRVARRRRGRRSPPRSRRPRARRRRRSPDAAAASAVEQVALDARQDHLRLRVAEAAVELEHARAVRR